MKLHQPGYVKCLLWNAIEIWKNKINTRINLWLIMFNNIRYLYRRFRFISSKKDKLKKAVFALVNTGKDCIWKDKRRCHLKAKISQFSITRITPLQIYLYLCFWIKLYFAALKKINLWKLKGFMFWKVNMRFQKMLNWY